MLSAELPGLEQSVAAAKTVGEAGGIERAEQALHKNRVLYFNNRLDAVVAGGFLLLVTAILLLSVREWVLLLARRKPAILRETEPVWLPDYQVTESQPFHMAGLAALVFTLTKELSGEAEMERAHQAASLCACEHGEAGRAAEMNGTPTRQAGARVYVEVAEKRFKGVKHCC